MIEFRHVTKHYQADTAAVDDFSLTVDAGSITVLCGASGCGKTTLLRMVNRMVEPTSGTILVDGEDIAAANPVALRRRIGYVLQGAGLLPHHRVIDNVAEVPRLLGTPRKQAHARALEMLELVGLGPDFARRWPAQLSGGQQQRVGVARALAAGQRILLMDEPFGAVDPIVRSDLQRELLRIHAELGTTTLFVTHDVDEAFRIGDKIVVLRPGADIAQAGTPAQIIAQPADEYVASFIGADRGDRALHIEQHDGAQIVVDGEGRATGILRDQQ